MSLLRTSLFLLLVHFIRLADGKLRLNEGLKKSRGLFLAKTPVNDFCSFGLEDNSCIMIPVFIVKSIYIAFTFASRSINPSFMDLENAGKRTKKFLLS